MTFARLLGDGDSLMTAEVLLELGFTQTGAPTPPAQGRDAGVEAQESLQPEHSIDNLGTPGGIFIEPDSGYPLYLT